MYEWMFNTPSGGEHRTPIFYLDGKFHEDILRNTYLRLGVIVFKMLGNEHTYKTKVDIRVNERKPSGVPYIDRVK